MIRATIEVYPRGDERERRTLAVLEIENIGGTPMRSEYQCVLEREDGTAQMAHIGGWPRRERDAAALVQAALYRMGYGREV